MKTRKAVLFLAIATAVTNTQAENEDQILLNAFHKFGITKCDKFILANSGLQENWTYYINKHVGGIDGLTTEVSITIIYGSSNDTVKIDDSYIQTPKNCYLHSRATLTFPGPCESNVDGDTWYISDPMAGKDYIQYRNKNGVELLVKEIQVGNFKACVQEFSKRLKGNQG